MPNKIGDAASRNDSNGLSNLTFLEEVARFCALAKLPEETAIATIRAAYRKDVASDGPHRSDFTDSLGSSQVLSAWHENSEFLDSDGMPATLSLSRGQFVALCRQAAIGSGADDVLQILVQSGAVRRNGDTVSVTRRDLIVGDSRPIAIARAVQTVEGLLSTINHNLTRNSGEPGRFERSVASRRLSVKQVPALLAHLAVHGQSFLEDLDSWMSARESKDACGTIGVGVYLFVDADELATAPARAAKSRRKSKECT